MFLLETPNLILRMMKTSDGAFMLKLLNDRSFIDNIGDRGVRTLAEAEAYITSSTLKSYAENGFGMYVVELSTTAESIGICGLVKRAGLADADIGFAFLPPFTRKGYGYESSLGVMSHAQNELKMDRLLAITSPGNLASIKLIEKLGFKYEKTVNLVEGKPEVKVFGINFT